MIVFYEKVFILCIQCPIDAFPCEDILLFEDKLFWKEPVPKLAGNWFLPVFAW